MRTSTAGTTRKTHKSRKTTPEEPGKPEISVASGSGPSTADPATAQLPDPDSNPIVDILTLVPKSAGKDTTSPAKEVVPAPIDPKDQWWYRPADSKARKKAEKIFVLRAAGHKADVIAKKLGTTEGTVRQIVFLARKNGWFDDNDEPVDLEAELALSIERKVVRNIDSSLDGQMTNWQTHEMTIAAAKGRGIFKNHDVVKGESTDLSIVQIQVIMPPVGVADQKIDEASVGGTPAYLEGDVDVDPGQALTEAAQSRPAEAVGTE